jgi:hypothetical protein
MSDARPDPTSLLVITSGDMYAAVPTILATSPGMVLGFFNLIEQPKSPSFTGPLEVTNILAPEKEQRS